MFGVSFSGERSRGDGPSFPPTLKDFKFTYLKYFSVYSGSRVKTYVFSVKMDNF